MNRTCDLELRLELPPFPDTDHRQHHHPSTTRYSHPMVLDDIAVNNGSLDQQRGYQPEKKLTVVYDGNICESNVTELQARAILILAGREMEMGRAQRRTDRPSSPIPASECHPNPWCSQSSSGLSMKRSLQRFLQKRKNRVQDASPY